MSKQAPTITMYSSPLCPYCHRARRLLKSKQVEFEVIDVGFHPDRRQEMIERAGGQTSVPQIFIGDHHVGGCDDLHQLERQGDLDRLLEGGDDACSEVA